MRVFIDASGSCAPEYAEGGKGRQLLDFLALYAEEGYAIQFTDKIETKQLFGPSEKIEVIPSHGGTDPNCLGPIHLGDGHELKVLLTDGLHPPITQPTKNLLTIDPSMDIDPKTLALHLSYVDATFRRLDLLATAGS